MSAVHWDHIFKKDLELVSWSENFTSPVKDNATAWGITTGEMPDLRNATDTVAICQRDKKGQRGPWSEIESAIVPQAGRGICCRFSAVKKHSV
jgi:hypothetical protein